MGLFTDWARSNVPKNPYTRIIARHLDSLGQVKDETLGMSSHGLDAVAPLRAAKDVVVTGILGTAFGVPGELAGQLGGDLALAGNATFESVTNPQGAGAKAYRDGGVDAYQATLAPQVRAAVGAEGTALSMIPDLALGGGKKTVQRAGAKIPEVAPGALRESLNARTFKELGDKILPIDKAGGAVQGAVPLLDGEGKAIKGLAAKAKGVEVTPFPALPGAGRQAPLPGQAPRQLGFPEPLPREQIPLPGMGEGSAGAATGAADAAPDLSLGNLNDRFNASPVALPGERAASAPARLNDLLNAAYGDKRRFAAPQLFKRLGARVEGDGSITREGRDITEQVHAFLEARPGMKPKEAEAALGALAEQVKVPPIAGGGDIAAGGGGMGIVPFLLPKSASTALIGAGVGGIAGGIADPDGGVDGMLGGALAGATVGYGAGRLPVGALKDTLGLMNTEGKRGFAEALQNGAFKFSSLAADWKADKVETIRGLGLDMLSGRVRALMNNVPQATINGSYRSLLDRWRAGGKFVPYDDELEQMAALNGLDPTKYDWSKLLGQGYMAGGAKSKALHPVASAAAGAAYSFANFGVESVPVLGQVFGAARGAARPYTSGAYRAANDLEQYAVRNAAFKQEARALLERAHAAFAGTLRGAGMDPALLSRQDGLYGAEEVAQKYGDEAGAAWRNIVDQIYGVAGATPKEQVDGLAGKFVKSTFGDYADPSGFTKAIDKIAPFSRYAVGQVKPLAQMARQNPAATLALAHWLQGDQRRAKAEGRPGYQVGTLRVDTQTPVVGRLVRAQLGGGEGEGRINPTQSVLGVSGGQVGATDQFEQADTPYKWAEAVLGTMGFQFNPLIGAAAFVVGGDYGTDRAPGAQSRFGRTEQALPGPRIESGRGLLNQVRGALGNEPDNFDPVDLLAKEIVFRQTGKPASDPSNVGYMEQLLDPNSKLMKEARARYEEGGNAANAVSAVSPITIQTNTAEKVAYRQAKVDQGAAGEKPSGAARMYADPKYPQGAIRNGKKVDPRLRDFETRNATLKRMAPSTYAKKRYQFILENKIKE